MQLYFKTATLTISSWAGISVGAQHYYGSITFYDEDCKYQEIELERVLNKRTAEILNEQRNKGRVKESYYQYSSGERTNCFNTEKHVREFALRNWKQIAPNCIILLEGTSACCDPQRCLSAPPPIKRGINMLYKKAEEVGWYEGDEKAMRKISNIYENFLKKCAKIYINP